MVGVRRKSALATLFLVAMLCVGMLGACGQPQQGDLATDAKSEGTNTTIGTISQEAATTGDVDVAKAFPSWNANSESLSKLVSYVQDVTNKQSANYVAPEERLATFDMDGTVLCEKAPVYVDYCLLMYRVLNDAGYDAPEEYKETCLQLRANANMGIVDDSLDAAKNEALVGSFEDMEPEQFRAYVNNFIDTQLAEGFDGMSYGESIYKPMKEVVDYLVTNEFDVYIVSACEREVARAIAVSKLGIAPDHVIGTDYGTKATGQGDEEPNKYTFEQSDELVFDGTKATEVAKLNKVVYIEREIGRRPILAFGNSSGDYAMLNYAQSNPDHKGMGLLVLCDDVDREYGDLERAATQAGEAEEAGWTTFSMANDWATIYGEGVTKTELPAEAEQLAEAA